MAKTVKQKLKPMFWLVIWVAVLGISFTAATAIKINGSGAGTRKLFAVFAAVIIVMLLDAAVAFGLLFDWFKIGGLRPGKVINILQWLAGFFGAAAIFDIALRLMERATWMVFGAAPFILDGILIALFMLWMQISHIINKDMEKNKVCEFC